MSAPLKDAVASLNDEGLKLLDQGRLAQATAKFRKAVEADPRNAAALNIR